MILRALMRLLSLVALAIAGWWVTRLVAGGHRAGKARQPRVEAVRGRMVRDRVCNTYLPREKALRLEAGDGEHFFCSEACRDRYLAARDRPGV